MAKKISKRKEPFNLILLGDPGAGKATQGRRLSKKYNLRDFDFGQWLRNLDARGQKKYKVKETAGKGMLTPTNLARAKFREVIFDTPKSKGILFDGNPKMAGEARLMYKWFREAGRSRPLVIYLSIPKKEMLKRTDIRVKIEKRSDDYANHLANRMKYYRKNIAATVAYLRRVCTFKKISGFGTRDQVFRRLVHTIEAGLKKQGKEHDHF